MSSKEKYLLVDPRQAGLSGDMWLAATAHLLQNWKELSLVLNKIVTACELSETNFIVEPCCNKNIYGCHLKAEIVQDLKPGIHGRELFIIGRHVISEIGLSDLAGNLGLRALKELLEAESVVHTGFSENWEKVHLHEAGSIDTLIDIFGTAFQFQKGSWLKVRNRILPLNVGGGEVTFSHGTMTVPPPAVLEILKRSELPWFGTPDVGELVTPTGVSIASAVGFIPIKAVPTVSCLRAGVGHGHKSLPIGNYTRFLEVLPFDEFYKSSPEILITIETHLDDLPGEVLGSAFESLLSAGAVDVIQYPFTGKKNRPGIAVRVLVSPEHLLTVRKIVIRDLGTLGFREIICTRHHVPRKIETKTILIDNRQFKVRIKLVQWENEWLQLKPEYDDVLKIMKEMGKSWREVMAELYYQLRKESNVGDK